MNFLNFFNFGVMDKICITPYDLAFRFKGVTEIGGKIHNPQILSMLKLDSKWPMSDEVPWCSAFVNYICWLLNIDRTKHLRARTWLKIGKKISISQAKKGFDIVILQRGNGKQPGPDVIDAPGHVGFFNKIKGKYVYILGGNQSNTVKISKYKKSRILGIRRLIK